MKEYAIISIDENKGGSDGHIIIVKANIVETPSGFAHLTKLFGKKYYSYAMHETNETEIFVFPYSDEKIQSLIKSAEKAEENKRFWCPDINEFYDANLMTEENEIKQIKKHISFRQQKQRISSGIKEIIERFEYNSFINESFFNFKGNEKIIKVKKVPLGEGVIYSGKAFLVGNIYVPNGFGVKLIESEDNMKIATFFRAGGMGKIAYLSYPNKYMYVGCVFDEEPNGWGFKLAKGQFTFGYFKEGKLYKDLSPFVTDLYYSIRGKKVSLRNIDGTINRLAFGLLPSEQQPFKGIQFLEDGTVYIGEGINANKYDLTGRYIRLQIDGKATFGHFNNGKVVKRMTQEEYFKLYTTKSAGQEKIDSSTDYLSTPDSGIYYIIGAQTKFDVNMGPVLSINALPYETLETPKDGNLSFNIKQIEYFYLYAEESIARPIKENSEKQRLWKINLDDFNTRFDYVENVVLQQTFERNCHIHNALIGLDYSNITDFDYMDIVDRLEAREMGQEDDF